MDENNVFRFGVTKGGKSEEDKLPVNDYIIVDIDNDEFFATGFLIFTPQHLAIMFDNGNGAIPVFCMPIGRVKAAELNEEVEDDSVGAAPPF